MKTIEKFGKEGIEVVRVSDAEAADLVRGGNWRYCSKSIWKKGVRDNPDNDYVRVRALGSWS